MYSTTKEFMKISVSPDLITSDLVNNFESNSAEASLIFPEL